MSAVAPPSAKNAATGPGMFSNVMSPLISGFIFERNDPPQRHPLSFAQRPAMFQPTSFPSPVSLVKPSMPLKSMLRDSSRMSARARSTPTATDQVLPIVQARFGLRLTTARLASREMYRPGNALSHCVFRPNGEVNPKPQAHRSLSL